MIIFPKGSVPVAVAAKVYKKDPAWVRAGIIAGWLPIGVATRDGQLVTDVNDVDSRKGRINFYISPKRLYEDTGFVWKGEIWENDKGAKSQKIMRTGLIEKDT